MDKFDISQAIKEKRMIDEAMKYDDAATKEIISSFHEVRAKFKDNEKLRSFYTQGIWWMSMMHDFLVPTHKLLRLFAEKYPHAFYISTYRHASANPESFRDIALARPDEVYDALVAMDLSCATKILCEGGFSEQRKTQLTNALATNSKKAFLDCLSQCNLPELYLQAFKWALTDSENMKTTFPFKDCDNYADIPEDEFGYVIRICYEEQIKDITNDSDVATENINDVRSWIDSLVSAIKMLSMPDDENTQTYILEIEDTEEYLVNIFFPQFYNLAIWSRYLYPFLNDYERESLDIMFRERKVCIKIQGKNETETHTLRTLLDELIKEMPYDKPFEKVSPTQETEEAKTQLRPLQHTQNGFAGYYLMLKPENLSLSTIISIAKDLSRQGTSENKKQFINPEDVNTFCWFFNGGENAKDIDFTKRIQWNSTAVSLKYLIALMYGASNPCQISQFKLQEGVAECVVNVFDYRMIRGPLRFDMKQRKQYFTKKVKLEDIGKEEKQMLIDIVSKHVPWELKFK